jgi:hypothetical protein
MHQISTKDVKPGQFRSHKTWRCKGSFHGSTKGIKVTRSNVETRHRSIRQKAAAHANARAPTARSTWNVEVPS